MRGGDVLAECEAAADELSRVRGPHPWSAAQEAMTAANSALRAAGRYLRERGVTEAQRAFTPHGEGSTPFARTVFVAALNGLIREATDRVYEIKGATSESDAHYAAVQSGQLVQAAKECVLSLYDAAHQAVNPSLPDAGEGTENSGSALSEQKTP